MVVSPYIYYKPVVWSSREKCWHVILGSFRIYESRKMHGGNVTHLLEWSPVYTRSFNTRRPLHQKSVPPEASNTRGRKKRQKLFAKAFPRTTKYYSVHSDVLQNTKGSTNHHEMTKRSWTQELQQDQLPRFLLSSVACLCCSLSAFCCLPPCFCPFFFAPAFINV